MVSGTGDDNLFSGSDDDSVWGDEGNDTLWGGSGDDEFTGGAGADTFVFAAGHGNDTVTDFDISEDILKLRNTVTDFSGHNDVIAASTQHGSNVHIDIGDGQVLVLLGLQISDLNSVNFVL